MGVQVVKENIVGHKVTVYECVICGKELGRDEYFTGFDMCKRCNRKKYDKKEYTDKWGNNKIDVILVDKIRKGV